MTVLLRAEDTHCYMSEIWSPRRLSTQSVPEAVMEYRIPNGRTYYVAVACLTMFLNVKCKISLRMSLDPNSKIRLCPSAYTYMFVHRFCTGIERLYDIDILREIKIVYP